MARIRSLKPEFWQDEKLAACSPHARLLGIAALQLADCAGRFRWIPMQVHAHAFPFEEDLNVDKLADELEQTGYLIRYEVDGKKYAEIPKFLKHQRLTGKEASQESSIPPREATGKQRGSTEVFPEKHLDAQERERERERERPEKKFSGDDSRTAEFMLWKIRSLNPKFKQPDLDKWADMVRLMRERDDRSDAEIRDLFVWANADSFWQANILSPSKLREKWDQLTMQRRGKKAPERDIFAGGQ